jgi:hypothetical protein
MERKIELKGAETEMLHERINSMSRQDIRQNSHVYAIRTTQDGKLRYIGLTSQPPTGTK